MLVVCKCVRLFIAVIITCGDQCKGGIYLQTWFQTIPCILAVRGKLAELTGNHCCEFSVFSLGEFFLHLTPYFSLCWNKMLAQAGYSKGLALTIVSDAGRINQSCRLGKTMLREGAYFKWRKGGDRGRRG